MVSNELEQGTYYDDSQPCYFIWSTMRSDCGLEIMRLRLDQVICRRGSIEVLGILTGDMTIHWNKVPPCTVHFHRLDEILWPNISSSILYKRY